MTQTWDKLYCYNLLQLKTSRMGNILTHILEARNYLASFVWYFICFPQTFFKFYVRTLSFMLIILCLTQSNWTGYHFKASHDAIAVWLGSKKLLWYGGWFTYRNNFSSELLTTLWTEDGLSSSLAPYGHSFPLFSVCWIKKKDSTLRITHPPPTFIFSQELCTQQLGRLSVLHTQASCVVRLPGMGTDWARNGGGTKGGIQNARRTNGMVWNEWRAAAFLAGSLLRFFSPSCFGFLGLYVIAWTWAFVPTGGLPSLHPPFFDFVSLHKRSRCHSPFGLEKFSLLWPTYLDEHTILWRLMVVLFPAALPSCLLCGGFFGCVIGALRYRIRVAEIWKLPHFYLSQFCA